MKLGTYTENLDWLEKHAGQEITDAIRACFDDKSPEKLISVLTEIADTAAGCAIHQTHFQRNFDKEAGKVGKIIRRGDGTYV